MKSLCDDCRCRSGPMPCDCSRSRFDRRPHNNMSYIDIVSIAAASGLRSFPLYVPAEDSQRGFHLRRTASRRGDYHKIKENLVRRRVECLGRNLIWQMSRTSLGDSNSEQRTPFSPSSEKGSDRPSPRAADFCCSWRGGKSKRSTFI